MPGCGTFSFNGLGSHILFPQFTLKIDDSVDSLVSYRSIGKSFDPETLDYAEPRASRATTAPAFIEDDEPPAPVASPPPKPTTTPDVVPPDVAPTPDTITKLELIESVEAPLSTTLLHKLHLDPTDLPPIHPSNTPSPCENRTNFDNLKLHRIFGCRKFKNQRHLIAASANAILNQTGELPLLWATMPQLLILPKEKQ